MKCYNTINHYDAGTGKEDERVFRLQKRNTAILFAAVVLILAGQLNINLSISGFRISLAIIFLPVLCFMIDDLPPFPVTVLAAPGVLVLRAATEWLGGAPLRAAVTSNAPELIFFLLYGALFSLYTRRFPMKAYRIAAFVPLAGIDLISNLGELLFRLRQTPGELISLLPQLLFVAAGRALLAAVITRAFDSYGIRVLKRSDHERYKKLLLLISQLKCEMVWMDKNAVQIEDTMSTAYKLYSELAESGDTAHAQQALTVAKDVHEIKKEYYLILRGIGAALELDVESGMELPEILQILRESLSREAESMGKQVEIVLDCPISFYTEKHYYLMSIFRNLLMNALEAAQQPAEVTLSAREDGAYYEFHVRDNCGGIPSDIIESIFLPGFSTKINYETGQISRGLGLNLVRNLIESALGGTITVESKDGGTDFCLRFPRDSLVTLKGVHP